jgi:NADH:ubiquinone oxidoreductase subunit F (NADH-binding)
MSEFDQRGPRPVTVSRLTAGWEQGRRATLREHIDRYGPLPPVANRDQDRLIHEVADAGLTGRGGAAFPTATKMRAVAAGRGPAVVVANGMESEPASEKDQALLARVPHLVLEGLVLAAEAVGAAEAHLCLAAHRDWLLVGVQDAVAERARAGLDRIPVTVHAVPESYVSSEETALVNWLNGGEAKPTFTPPRPFERGVGKRPTLVDNVETLAHLALIARYGARWFRQAGAAGAAGSMLTTVTGAVARPGVYEIEAGARIGDVLTLAGAHHDAAAVLVGGYFGTWHDVGEIAGLPFTRPGLSEVGGGPGAGVLFVLPAAECGLSEAASILGYLASQSAQQCGPCMFGLPAIAADLARLAAGRPDGDLLGRLHRRFGLVSGRGACRHPDGAVRMAASALTTFAADAHAHSRQQRCLASRRGAPAAAATVALGRRGDGAWS